MDTIHTQPVRVIETSIAKIDVFPRPGYCDRGNYQPMTMTQGDLGFLKTVISQYYFDLDLLEQEMHYFAGLEGIRRDTGDDYNTDQPTLTKMMHYSTQSCLLQAAELKRNSVVFWKLFVLPTVSPESGFNIDAADGFPRYYSSRESLVKESDLWVKKRGLKRDSWTNLILENFPKL